MNRDNFWKLIFILIIILWSAYEIYPPTARDLVQSFQERAVRKDAAFNDILHRARERQKTRPDRGFSTFKTPSARTTSRSIFRSLRPRTNCIRTPLS